MVKNNFLKHNIKMGRIISHLIIIFILFQFLTSCSKIKSEENSKELTLTLWQGFKFQEIDYLEKFIKMFCDEFEKKHNLKIRIVTEQIPFDDMITKIKTACLAYATPDMAIVDANKVVEMAYGRVLVPLDELKSFGTQSIEEFGKEYVPSAFGTNVIDIKGKVHLYGLPAQTNCLVLFYNKDLFARRSAELVRAGLDPNRPPENWDEMIEYGKILTEPEKNIYGLAYRNSLWFHLPWLYTYGGLVFDKDKNGQFKCVINSPLAYAALKKKVDMYLKYKIEAGAWQSGAIDPDQGFVRQSYAMIFTGPWNVQKFKDSGINFGVGLIPRVSKKEAIELGLISKDSSDEEYNDKIKSSSNVGGQDIIMFKTCKYKEYAFEFMRFYTSEKIQRMWAEGLGQIPVNIKSQQGLDLAKHPIIPIFIEQMNLSKPQPPLPLMGILENDIINPEIDIVLQGKKDLKAALDDIVTKANKNILPKLNE